MASTTLTYGILTGAISVSGSIRHWAQHSSIPADQILEEAQAFIYQTLRVRWMSYETPISLPVGDHTLAVPDDFLDPIWLRFDGDTEDLDYVQENLLAREVDSEGVVEEGRPERWSIFNNLIQFNVKNGETAAIAGDLLYYRVPPLLSALNATNFLTDRFPTLLRRACLAFAYEHRKRMADFNTEILLVEAAIDRANATGDMARRGQIMR